MEDGNAVLLGQAIGYGTVFLGVSALVLFATKKHKGKPLPYVSAGVAVGVMGWAVIDEGNVSSALFAVFAMWCALLWRYKIDASATPSRAGRTNAIWLGFLLLFSALTLATHQDEMVSAMFSSLGIVSVMAGTLGKWVLLAPRRQQT